MFSPALFFPALFRTRNAEIRELSVRGRPERGWSRRDHAVHDARGRARRQVMMMMRFISRRSFPFEFVALFPVVESDLSLSLFAMHKKGRRRWKRAQRERDTVCWVESSSSIFEKRLRDDAMSPPGTTFGCLKEKLNGPLCWHLIDRFIII